MDNDSDIIVLPIMTPLSTWLTMKDIKQYNIRPLLKSATTLDENENNNSLKITGDVL